MILHRPRAQGNRKSFRNNSLIYFIVSVLDKFWLGEALLQRLMDEARQDELACEAGCNEGDTAFGGLLAPLLRCKVPHQLDHLENPWMSPCSIW